MCIEEEDNFPGGVSGTITSGPNKSFSLSISENPNFSFKSGDIFVQRFLQSH